MGRHLYFCAILTRLQAIALFPALLYLIYKDKPFLKKPAHWVSLISPAIAVLSTCLYASKAVKEIVVPTVETTWRTYLAPPWESYWYALRTIASGQVSFIDILNLFYCNAFYLYAYRRLAETANRIQLVHSRKHPYYVISHLGRAATFRYVSVALSLFPMFILLGLIGENHPESPDPLPAILLNLYLSARFWMWGWVA